MRLVSADAVVEDAPASMESAYGPVTSIWLFRPRAPIWARLLVILLVSALSATLLVTGSGEVSTPALVGIVVISTLIWLIALWGATARVRVRGLDPLTTAAVGTATGLALLGTLNFVLLDGAIAPAQLLLMGGGVFLLALAQEGLGSTALRPPARRVVFVLADVPPELAQIPNGAKRDFRFLGVISDREALTAVAGMPRLGRSRDLLEVVSRERADLLVVSSNRRCIAIANRLLDQGVTSTRVITLSDFYERVLHRVPLMSPSWFTSLLDFQGADYPRRRKRAFDIVAATVALFVFSPLFLLIWCALRISGRPVFYRQKRSGEGGKEFQVVKFRTMVPDAENGTPVWAAERDLRITRIGRILRRTRLDELPQFWNVLRGDMSVVGPRPERPEYIGLLEREVRYWNRRLLVKPGITGWAQLQLGYTNDVSGAASKLSYDLYYLKHRSLSFDVLILIATFRLLLTGHGAR